MSWFKRKGKGAGPNLAAAEKIDAEKTEREAVKKKPRQIKSIFENDKFLRVLSVLLAVFIWYFVFLSDDSEYRENVYNIPISIKTEGTATGQLGLEVIEGEGQTVDIAVEGRNMVIGDLKNTGFTATASLSAVTSAGTYELPVEVVSTAYSNIQIVSKYPSKIQVKFDKIVTKTFPVQADVTGVEIADGYLTEASYASPASITVTGPEQEVLAIDKVTASAELTEPLTKTADITSPVALLDKNGNVITGGHLTLDYDETEITIPVKKKKVLNLTFGFINAPSGLVVDNLNYEMSATQIEVAGNEDIIDKLTEINLGYVNMKSLVPGETLTFNVELPSGLLNIQNLTTVSVEFPDENTDTKTFNVSNIQILNKPSDYKVTVSTKRIPSVKIVGDKNILDKLSADSIVAEIDLSSVEIQKGEQTLPVSINIPGYDLVWAVGDYSAILNITDSTS